MLHLEEFGYIQDTGSALRLDQVVEFSVSLFLVNIFIIVVTRKDRSAFKRSEPPDSWEIHHFLVCGDLSDKSHLEIPNNLEPG